MTRWHLITGEYPPGGGGIGDYTRLLAAALAERGSMVDVWTPAADAADPSSSTMAETASTSGRCAGADPRVHRLPALHGRGLRQLTAGLAAAPAPRRLLIQYAPQAMGRRGLNVPFCAWALARRHAGDDVRVMFHEPYFPFGWQRPQRNVLAAINRAMARLLLRASTHAYVSTSAWIGLLRPLAPRHLPFATLPIPSTIPRVDDADAVARTRWRLLTDGSGPLIAHFGTYGELIAPMLAAALRELWRRHPHARVLLLGRGSEAFSAQIQALCPTPGSVVSGGHLPAAEVSIHLQAADAALQPYPDGADTRRTTLMACVANCVPTLSTDGRFTDMVWRNGPVSLVPATQPREMAGEVLDRVLAADRTELARQTRGLYQAAFAMEHTVDRLLAEADGLP